MKLTTAQTWLSHSLEVLLLGAAMSGTIAGYQMVASGNYGWQSIVGVIGAAAIAVIAKGLSSTILDNNNLMQAIADTVIELKAAGNAVQAPASPLHVIVHNSPSIEPASPIVTPTAPITGNMNAASQTVQVDMPLGYTAYNTATSTQVNIPSATGVVAQGVLGVPSGSAIQYTGVPLYFGDTASVPAVQAPQS